MITYILVPFAFIFISVALVILECLILDIAADMRPDEIRERAYLLRILRKVVKKFYK